MFEKFDWGVRRQFDDQRGQRRRRPRHEPHQRRCRQHSGASLKLSLHLGLAIESGHHSLPRPGINSQLKFPYVVG